MEKINKLLEKEDKIDTLINTSEERWQKLLRMRSANKDETARMLNEQIEIIDQLIELVDALCVEPLAYRRPPQSLESQNASDQRNQEEPEINFSGCMYNPRLQNREYKKFKKELLKYDGKDNRGAVIWVNKMDGIFE
jgi:hypothetical protein